MIIIGAIGDRVELLYDINTSKGKFKKGTIGELFKTYASQNEFNIELYLPAQSVGSRKYNVYEKFKREDVRFICNEFQVGDIVKIVRRYPMAYFGTSGKIVGKSRFPFVYRVKIYGEQLYRDFAGEELELVENLSIINVGDIVIPLDGSSMNPEAHKMLFTETPHKSFKPVVVLAVEGNLLGVAPLNVDKYWYNPGKQSFWGNGDEYGSSEKLGEGFWIDRRHVKKSMNFQMK